MISRSQWVAIPAALIAAVLGNVSCVPSEGARQTIDYGVQSSNTIVPAARVTRSNITNATILTAEFQPFQEIDVMAKVAGYVRTIRVDLGDRVATGQLIAELEIPEMNDEISKAAAVVEQGGAEIGTARDELQRAESSHQIAHLSYMRLVDVGKREPGLIPQQELDESRSRDLIAEAQVASAKSRLRVEEQRTTVARTEEKRLRTMRNYVRIVAPFAGTVTKRYANVGAMIQAGTASQSQAMPLARLSQISTLRLSLPVPESLVPKIRVGRPVDVRVRSMDRNFQGKISRFASRVDTATRTMVAEVDVPNPGELIMPGMYAEVSLEQHDDVLSAPLEAIERAGSNSRVYAIDKSGAVQVIPVQLGIEDAQKAQIISGLAEGDLVITGARTGLKAGDKVTPKITQ